MNLTAFRQSHVEAPKLKKVKEVCLQLVVGVGIEIGIEKRTEMISALRLISCKLLRSPGYKLFF